MSATTTNPAGLVANRESEAHGNYVRLQMALDRGQPIVLPAGDIYVNALGEGPLRTPAKVSCGRIDTVTAGGYSIDPTPALGKLGTRIIWQGTGPFLRISGAGFVLNGPLEITGDGVSDCIQVEGRAEPATGRHRFRDVIFRNWGCAWHALAEPAEAHADNSRTVDCEVANVACVFRSDNQQAVNWRFDDLVVNNLGGPTDQVVCDIRRGGLVTIDRLICCHPRVTVFRVGGFSPHTCRLICRDLEFDRVAATDAYLTAFHYAGPTPAESWRHWLVDVDGFACLKLPTEKLIVGPPELNCTDIHVNVRSLY